METKYRIVNGEVFDEQDGFVQKEIYIVEERVVSKEIYLSSTAAETILDADGQYVIPGLVDIHFHGCMGSDCCDGTTEAFETIARYELRQGILAITPATTTTPESVLAQVCRISKDFFCPDGADFCGLYMEGPFINPAKKGGQNELFVHRADSRMFSRLQTLSGGKIHTVTVAPEMEGAMDFIRENRGHINISLGHTAADYETAKLALANGASQITHMFNAMPSFAHRAPGPVGAAADNAACMVELICDGIHIHPCVVRTAFKIFGDNRIIFISDSIRAAGMPDGRYDVGGQEAVVNGSLVLLKDGTITGSAANLMNCMRNAVLNMGIPLHSAVKCASVNPARAAGLDRDYGSPVPGKYANIVFLDQELNLTRILHRGRVFR